MAIVFMILPKVSRVTGDDSPAGAKRYTLAENLVVRYELLSSLQIISHSNISYWHVLL